MPFLLSLPFGTCSISSTLYLQAPPPSLSLFNIYLLPLMSFQSAAPSHFWYHCPYPFHSSLSIFALLPNSHQSATHSVYFEINCAYFCSAHPSLSPSNPRSSRPGSARLSHLQFCDDVGANSRSRWMGSVSGHPAVLLVRAGGPSAAVMRLAASFSNFDDVVSPLPTVRGGT